MCDVWSGLQITEEKLLFGQGGEGLDGAGQVRDGIHMEIPTKASLSGTDPNESSRLRTDLPNSSSPQEALAFARRNHRP